MRLTASLLGLALLATPAFAFAQTSTQAPTKSTTTTTPMSPATPGMSAPAAMTPPAAATAPAGPGKMSHATSSTGASDGVTHYASQSEAAAACGSGTVVWANPRSKAMHTSESKHFGKTKTGFYACQKDAMAGGYHMAGTAKKHSKTS